MFYSASIISPYSISSWQPLGPQQKCGKSNSMSIFFTSKFYKFCGSENDSFPQPQKL